MAKETEIHTESINLGAGEEITVDVITSDVPIQIDQPLNEPDVNSGITISPGEEIEIDVP